MTAKLQKLAAEIIAMSPPERFRVVALMLEEGTHPHLALGIARRTVDELRAAMGLFPTPTGVRREET